MKELRECQLELLKLLQAFDRACKKCGLQYWLDSGTLLGALRHQGFIPWDDDLDLCILKSEFKKHKQELEEALEEPYELVEAGSTERLYPRIINKNCRIKRKDSLSGKIREDCLWIDLFLVREVSPKLKRIADPLYGRCTRRLCGAVNDGALRKTAALLLYPAALLLKAAVCLHGQIFCRGLYSHDFGVPFYSLRLKKDIFPLGSCIFEGSSFPAPKDSDAYLSLIYGNWRQLPPPEKRQNHDILL